MLFGSVNTKKTFCYTGGVAEDPELSMLLMLLHVNGLL
jgi:hypothetical protein